jgi:hypothetical protein
VETPTELATDAYASMINWEAHGRDGLRYEVMGQEMPDPLKPIGKLPAAFQRLYHTIVTDPAGLTAWDQYPAKDGAEAWRVATAVSDSGDLELRIQHGGYRAGSVQDWAGDDDATLTVLLTDAGELTIKRGELELTYDDESGTLTVRAEKVVLESDDVRMAQGDRPVLVREPGATLPPGITEATEVQV